MLDDLKAKAAKFLTESKQNQYEPLYLTDALDLVAGLLAAVAGVETERDAIMALFVEQSAVVVAGQGQLYDVMLPDSSNPYGFSWKQGMSREDAVTELRKAAGLEG